MMKKNGRKKLLACCLAVLLLGKALHIIGRNNLRPVLAPFHGPAQQLILDAGHGGEDGGAVSLSGVSESTINLAIALKIDQLLGFYGVCPYLLRESDISLHEPEADTLRKKKVSDLKNRVRMIEATENAVVISIHQNTFPSQAYHGAQVFYREGEESADLAALFQETLKNGIDRENQRQPTRIPDSIYLMQHITCPAVLIECGFLSNPTEEQKLLSAGYQTQLAVCIAAAWLQHAENQSGNLQSPVV